MLDVGAICTGRRPPTPVPSGPGPPGSTRPAQGLQGRVPTPKMGVLTQHPGLRLVATFRCEGPILKHGRGRALGLRGTSLQGRILSLPRAPACSHPPASGLFFSTHSSSRKPHGACTQALSLFPVTKQVPIHKAPNKTAFPGSLAISMGLWNVSSSCGSLSEPEKGPHVLPLPFLR